MYEYIKQKICQFLIFILQRQLCQKEADNLSLELYVYPFCLLLFYILNNFSDSRPSIYQIILGIYLFIIESLNHRTIEQL